MPPNVTVTGRSQTRERQVQSELLSLLLIDCVMMVLVAAGPFFSAPFLATIVGLNKPFASQAKSVSVLILILMNNLKLWGLIQLI